MKKIFILSVIWGVIFCFLLFHAGAEPVSVLLEKGIYLEETKGDLNGAMEIYKTIMEESDTNRAYAAQAQYRLGMCHMKKGEKEKCIQILIDLVAKYPEQTDLVEKAKKQIPEVPKTETEMAKIRDDALAKGNLTAAGDAEMGRVLIRKKEGKSKEEILSETKDEAMAKGDLIAACDAEMQRVLYRKEGGNVWKDKIDLSLIYENYVRDNNPSKEWKLIKLKELEQYRAKHKGDVEYEWRILDLFSTIHTDIGQKNEAIKYLEAALEAYPYVQYPIPSKHSKYNHMVNKMAGLIWDKEGVEKAEAYFLGKLEQDKKCEYFYSRWWSGTYEKTGMKDRYLPMLNRVEKAYQKRISNFPEKKPQIEKSLQWLNGEKTRLMKNKAKI